MVKSLILCEGGLDVGFLTKFCKYLKLNIKKIDIQKISKEEKKGSGKSAFFKSETYVTIKQKVSLGQYNKILFIVDADYIENDSTYGGIENTENALSSIIKELGFEDNSKYCIMCDKDKGTGNLEHLILSTIDIKKTGCIDTFLNCIDNMQVHSNKKIILSSYEAIFKESPYNLDHDNFNDLRELLLWISE